VILQLVLSLSGDPDAFDIDAYVISIKQGLTTLADVTAAIRNLKRAVENFDVVTTITFHDVPSNASVRSLENEVVNAANSTAQQLQSEGYQVKGIQTEDITPNETSSSGSGAEIKGSSEGSDLSTGTKVGIGIGLGLGVPFVIGGLVFYYFMKLKEQNNRRHISLNQII